MNVGGVVVVYVYRIVDSMLVDILVGQLHPGHPRQSEYCMGHGIVVDSGLTVRIEDVVAGVCCLQIGLCLSRYLPTMAPNAQTPGTFVSKNSSVFT